MKNKKDSFGDRMKMYESQTTQTKLIPLLPVIARLDGKCFSKFTKDLKRPYDERLSKLMIETTKYMVAETNANCAYTQSDEITLCWYNPDPKSNGNYNGKIFKIITDLSAMCSVFFNEKLAEYLPEKVGKRPRFDCRVWNVPNEIEAVNVFIWREQDATKNSISMAAQSFYSHKQLHKKNGSEKQEMLFQKGVNWNDYPTFFKKGTYIQKKVRTGKMTIDEIDKLPLKHNARKKPELEIKRTFIEELDLPPLSKVYNKIDVILYGKDMTYSKLEKKSVISDIIY
jgi:tRNA(His) 5'-end guanylyltransferase